MSELERNSSACAAILRSIREHLAESLSYDAVHGESGKETAGGLAAEVLLKRGNGGANPNSTVSNAAAASSLVETFKENLEAVGGHCFVAESEADVAEALTRIISGLQNTPLRGRRLALSNAPIVKHLTEQMKVEVDEIAVDPTLLSLFNYDIGITSAQAAIAETGTLVLKSECERHRLVSLVPPVHIATVEAASIRLTLGETLATLRQDDKLSPTITFITGPSRTADIELTLAIGVHGPQELYVIVTDYPKRVA